MYKLKSKNVVHNVLEQSDIDSMKDEIIASVTESLNTRIDGLQNSIQTNTTNITTINKDLSDIKAGSTVVAIEETISE